MSLDAAKSDVLLRADGVALVGELLVVVLAEVGAGTGEELLGTAAEVGIRAVHLGPGSVGEAIEGLFDERAIGIAGSGVGRQGDGGSISDESSGDGTPGRALRLRLAHCSREELKQWRDGETGRQRERANTYPDTVEKLNNGLDLGVVVQVREESA